MSTRAANSGTQRPAGTEWVVVTVEATVEATEGEERAAVATEAVTVAAMVVVAMVAAAMAVETVAAAMAEAAMAVEKVVAVKVAAGTVAAMVAVETAAAKEGCQRSHHAASDAVPFHSIIATIDAIVIAQRCNMLLARRTVRALLPRPDQLVVEAASSEASRHQLSTSAQTRAVLGTAVKRLQPSGPSVASTHRHI